VDYLIEDSLRDFLGDGRSPYHLTLSNESAQRSLGLSATGIARQYALVITTDYVLTDASGAVIAEGRLREESLFDAGSDPYTLVSGASNAEEQASEAMAERLVREIAVALRQREATTNR
jgi:LPS-assembly lipoprotein